MNDVSSKGRGWLLPGFAGLVLGALVVGTPLAYHTAQLQAALAASEATAAQLKDQLSKAAAANGQLAADRAKLTTDNSQLQASNSELSSERQLLQSREVQLAKPDLPIRVNLRRALLSAGLVLTIQNLSTSNLPITAQMARAGAPPQTRELVIPPNGMREIGEQQGWAFLAGDSVMLSNPGFRPWANPSLPPR